MGLTESSEFDVGYFCAANDFFLGFGGELVPRIEVVKILLDDHVASTGESDILLADDRSVDRQFAVRIFRPIDETQQIAVVEVAEPVHLVHR